MHITIFVHKQYIIAIYFLFGENTSSLYKNFEYTVTCIFVKPYQGRTIMSDKNKTRIQNNCKSSFYMFVAANKKKVSKNEI